MNYHQMSLLAVLMGFVMNIHAAVIEYQYDGKCRNFKHVDLFEQCLDKELAFYDGKLNGLYLSFPRNAPLENAELSWIKFKETDCRFMAQSSKDPVYSRLIYKACVIDKTKNRINDLKKINAYIEWFRTV